MSSNIWTPRDIAAEARPWRGVLWRMAELQHVASTMKLVDTRADQDVLDALLARSEIPGLEGYPIGGNLRTLFKQSPLPTGSRLQTRLDPGALVGADSQIAACAELGYWRWRFIDDSLGLAAIDPAPFRPVEIDIAARAIDMRVPAFDSQGQRRLYPKRPLATRAFARAARESRIDALLYRPPHHEGTGTCIALLSPSAIASPRIRTQPEVWYLRVDRSQATWRSESRGMSFSADRWA